MSTAYKGLIGKLGKDIFKNPGAIGRYAGIGAGVGVVGGAMMSDDGIMSGAMRGGVFGAALGAGIHWAPRAINKTIKDSGFIEWDRANTAPLLSEGFDSFKPVYDTVNDPAMKKTMKDFVPAVTEAFSSTKNNKDFAREVQIGVIEKAGGMDKATLNSLMDIGNDVGDGITKIKGLPTYQKARDWQYANEEIWDKMSTGKKVGLGTSVVAKMGFDSAYHHIVEPTGKFIRKTMAGKKPTMGQSAAAAFSLYGGYEAYHIGNDVADGNKLSALGCVCMLVAGKLAFSQAGNAIALHKEMVKRNITPMGVAKAGIGGIGARKLALGYRDMDAADHLAVQTAARKRLTGASANMFT